ncbi:hypothetical protein HY418_01840 [Candidatus Kaiserbacteria bacterium]|nr:hypothetical protein [Candidatus Kaiserbacteria bacterium]
MALLHAARPAAIAFLVVTAALLLGNQRHAFALVVEPGLGSRIVCTVFTYLDEQGRPIPHLLPNGCPLTPPPGGGTLTVKKQVSGGSASPSAFSIHIKAQGSDIDGSPQGGSASGTTYTGFPPGSYSVNETGGPSGYVASFSGACDSSGTVTISEGDILTCTITNTFAPVPAQTQCADLVDNDGDGEIDAEDSGCHTDHNPHNSASYDPTLDDESAVGATQCSDGADNDSDGLTDSDDPACHTDFDPENQTSFDPNRNDESATPSVAQCADGIDNDADDKVDIADPGCHTDFDADNQASFDLSRDDESATAPSNGGTPPPSENDTGPHFVFSGGNGPTTGSYGIVDGTAGGAVLGASSTAVIEEAPECNAYLTAFIRYGKKDNDTQQVRRLQLVLRDFEHASVEVNGIYDMATLAAVNAFQQKYAAEILTPWGITQPTGYVYLTTRKKVNEVYCNNTKAFPLTQSQLQEIAQVRAQVAPQLSTPVPRVPATPAPLAPKSAQPLIPVAVSSEAASPTQASSTAGNGRNFWNFIDFLRDILPR